MRGKPPALPGIILVRPGYFKVKNKDDNSTSRKLASGGYAKHGTGKAEKQVGFVGPAA
jgi:hypothetical protein